MLSLILVDTSSAVINSMPLKLHIFSHCCCAVHINHSQSGLSHIVYGAHFTEPCSLVGPNSTHLKLLVRLSCTDLLAISDHT